MIPSIVVCAALIGLAGDAAAQGSPSSPAGVYNGRDRQLDVAIPRLDDVAVIDGAIDEPVWMRAAQLTGFSRYLPVDGAAADQATEVLAWYSPTAIYFAVRAEAAPGGVRATLADRDRLTTDDQVLFFLSTFNDSRQAFVFAVNPLGVQADGSLVEGAAQSSGGFSGLASGRETPDLSQDFVFQSRGRLTDRGFEIEIRVPFKSLRYQDADRQDWGFNVTRVVASEGREDSWAPASRQGASFLSQAGRLRGLTELRRGVVLDLNPVATARIDGARDTGGWRYDTPAPEAGLNVRWGVTANLTLNGTINPDFSQVEADAGQFQFDPRSAVFFAEKRPFFLDALEQFATPNNLIYTRRIVEPTVAAKLTGKLTPTTSVALLSAIDAESQSRSGGDAPIFTIARVQQDIGGQSKIAAVFTHRHAGADVNRVVGTDTRIVFGDIYAIQAQAAISRTESTSGISHAPLWQVTATRSGRHFAFRYHLSGIDPDFRAAAGFIRRGGIASLAFTHQAIVYGARDSWVERLTSDVVLDGSWRYDDLVAGRSAQDRKLHWNNNVTMRGGWRLGASLLVETFGYDPDLYRDYVLVDQRDGTPTLRPFTGVARLPNLDYVVSVNMPQRLGVSIDAFVLWGRDENFYEWASADIVFANVGALWRPTERLRLDGRFQTQTYRRRTDGSYVGIRRIPRLKVEYQMTRATFLRIVGEFDGQFRDALRDDSRTNLPIAVLDPATGVPVPALKQTTGTLRLDALFSYQPTPGTLLFLGYGSTSTEPTDHRQDRLRRLRDGFFAKVSYLIRL